MYVGALILVCGIDIFCFFLGTLFHSLHHNYYYNADIAVPVLIYVLSSQVHTHIIMLSCVKFRDQFLGC